MFYGTTILLLFLTTASCWHYPTYNLTAEERQSNKNYLENSFHCGNGFWSGLGSISLMSHCRTPISDQFNHCCALHDDCYDLQRNKNDCDAEFLYCNENAVKARAKSLEICWPWLKFSYAAMDSGDAYDAYKNAATKKHNGPFYIPTHRHIYFQDLFASYYRYCKYHRIVVSSCAFNFQRCVQNGNSGCGVKNDDCIPQLQNGLMPDYRNGSSDEARCFHAIRELKGVGEHFDEQYS